MRQRLVVTNSESNAPSLRTLSTPAASLWKRSRPVGPIPLRGPRNGLYHGATLSCASLVSFRTSANSDPTSPVGPGTPGRRNWRSEEHTSELQSHSDLVCRLLLEKKKK